MKPSSLRKWTGDRSQSAISAKTLVAELIASCPMGVRFDANAAIARHPELTNHRSALLELAYEEYGRCHDLGIEVQPGEFAAQFPTIARSLLHQIEVHHLFADGPQPEDLAENAAWPMPGQEWLDFQLLEELGRGAYSRVFLAREKSLGDRLVVVKATSLGPREAHTLGRLQHPQIVPVHSVQRDEQLGLTALCMPFLSRATLFDVMDAVFSSNGVPREAATMLSAVRRLNAMEGVAPDRAVGAAWPPGWSHAEAVLAIGIQVAQALQHAHEQGVLHGDVKPSNVLVTDSGRAVLLDFNLAIFGDESTPFIAGTLPYMAPEQLQPLAIRGTALQKTLDERSDVFGLGVTLFELLYGQSPFGPLSAENSRELIAARLLDRQHEGPVSPQGKTPREEGAIRDVIVRCLAVDPAQRPQTMAELVGMLGEQLKPGPRLRRWLRRNRRLTIAAATIVGMGMLSLGIWQARRDPYPLRELRAGILGFDEGRYSDAEVHFTKALHASPDLREAKIWRGLVYFKLGLSNEAHGDLDALCADDPGGLVNVAVAHVYADLNQDVQAASALYERAIREGYRSVIVQYNWGRSLYKSGRLHEAATALKAAIELDPDLGVAHHNLAVVEFQIARREHRQPDTTFIKSAFLLNPESADLYLDAALTYALLASSSTQGPEFNGFADQVCNYLSAGLALGLPRERLDLVGPVDPRLNRCEQWRSLAGVHPSGRSSPSPIYMLDPLPELLQKLRQVPRP